MSLMRMSKTVSSATQSDWIPVNNSQTDFKCTVLVDLSVGANLTYTVQYTLDNIQDSSVTPTAFDSSELVGETTDGVTSFESPIMAVRLNVTAYTGGSAVISIAQSPYV